MKFSLHSYDKLFNAHIQFYLVSISDSAAIQFYPQLLNVKISCMLIAQNQTFDAELSIQIIKSHGPFFNDILFIRSYVNSITRHPSVVLSLYFRHGDAHSVLNRYSKVLKCVLQLIFEPPRYKDIYIEAKMNLGHHLP
ncbi:Hypothetical_protein [Hexamita inflata]|uniref:Hypothetical_protein n=1 Tax=Hexamita inflata TaxID=28002 RepID=A0AA86NQV8_9EUKA|nr:Hypothetical protein HINF_LOCUS12417 [Hexamita inflata]